MPVTVSSDQAALRDTTARFLDDLMPPEEVRQLRDDTAGYASKYWARGAELGWTSLLVGEEHGGGTVSGSPVEDLALIAYSFGTHAAPGPLIPVNVVAAAIARYGSSAQQERLEDLLTGASTAAWCYSADLPLEIRADGSDLVINGVQRPVENAGQADLLLVAGRADAGRTQVLVEAGTPGLSIKAMDTVDLTRRFAEVRFDNVRVPAAAALGPIGGADSQIHDLALIAVVLLNAESVGAMQRAFDMTLAWVTDRYSFGRPIASYQEIKHRFADMLSWLEGSHAINDAAISALDAGSPDAANLASAAKAFVGHYGAELMQDCVQLHGGIGLTFEHDLHLFLRRVTVNRALFGTPAQHRQLLGAGLAQRKDPS